MDYKDILFHVNGIDPVYYLKTPKELADHFNTGHIQRFTRYCLLCKHKWQFAFDWRNKTEVIAGLHAAWVKEVFEHTEKCRGVARY